MIRNLNPGKLTPMAGLKLAEWKRLGDLTLAALIVSPERAREIIEKLYPEKEMMGRPGRFAPPDGQKAPKKPGRKTDCEFEDAATDEIDVLDVAA